MPEISLKAINWIASEGIPFSEGDYVYVCNKCGAIHRSMLFTGCQQCGGHSLEKNYKYYDLIPPDMMDEGYEIVYCRFCDRGLISKYTDDPCDRCQDKYDLLDSYFTYDEITEPYEWEE